MGKEWWNSHRRSHSRVGYGLGWHSGTDGHLFQCISLCCSCPKTPLPCSGPSRSLSSPSHSNLFKIWSMCTLLISLSPLYNSQLMAPAFSSQLNWWFLNWGRWGCFLYLCTFGPIDHSFLLKVLCPPGFPGTILTRSSSNHSFSVSFITFSSSSPGLQLSPLLFSPPHSPSELSSTVMIYSYS